MDALGDMETPTEEHLSGDGLTLPGGQVREAALLAAISKMSITLALREHVRCQKEYEDWLPMRSRVHHFQETDRLLQAKSLQSVATTRFAARACGRYLRAEGVAPERMVILVKQIVERVLDETKLDHPDPLRMRVLTWAIEGYYGGD